MKRFIFSKIGIWGILALFGLSGITLYVWKQEHRLPLFEMYVFGLKNSTAAFIRTPDDKRILINGGSNSEVIRHISRILPFYSRRIDLIVATDTEKKNITGLIGVVGRYSIERVIVPAITLDDLNLVVSTSTDRAYETFMSTVRKATIPIREIRAGEEISFNSYSSEAVGMNILFPVPSENFSYSKASPPEILFMVTHGSAGIMWAGNSSKKIQKYMSSVSISTPLVPIDVLVVSHSALLAHVDRTFIETYQPRFLIYSQSVSGSSGTNPFPYDSRFNIQENTIRIVSDGISVHVERIR